MWIKSRENFFQSLCDKKKSKFKQALYENFKSERSFYSFHTAGPTSVDYTGRLRDKVGRSYQNVLVRKQGESQELKTENCVNFLMIASGKRCAINVF